MTTAVLMEAGMIHSNAATNMASDVTSVKSEPNYDTVRQTLRESISRESIDEIRRIVRDVEKLSKLERLLLYMELPSSLSTLSDPLRQPLNPLGSRFEIQLTITWIKTHLEEDQQVSLPKHEVYDDYLEYCNANSLKPLSTADFGKVMKQVYPQVRPRRLGTRGNSRYCYAGLKKRLKLEDPVTPECGMGAGTQAPSTTGNNGKLIKVNNVDYDTELNDAASVLIREWAGKLLNAKFPSLKELTLYLIDKMFVDNRSSAAHTILTSMSNLGDSDMKHKPDGILLNGGNPQPMMYDHKRKIDIPVNTSELASNVKRPNLKRSKYGLSDNNSSSIKSPVDLNAVHCGDKQAAVSVQAMVSNEAPVNQYTSVFEEDQFLHHDNGQNKTNGKEVVGQGSSSAANAWGNTDPNLDCIKPWDLDSEQQQTVVGTSNEHLKMEGSCEPTVDEEVDKYFKNNSPNSADAMDNNQKLSQLRTMLVEKLKSPSIFKPASKANEMNWNPTSTTPGQAGAGGAAVGATGQAMVQQGGQQPSLSTRRRVSFIVQDPSVHQQHQHQASNGGPPAPGTRKRHCSFQPISPRQASLPHSPSASPFISPRSTPVHMMRSRHSSGSALPLHMLPCGTSKGPFGSSGSDISRAATFGSASECSTPFISPHGTPIPFNRSRHNSAQGRLCRSRHSSGVGPYRYTVTPFSPMALSNLNNPYSPQPSTPVGSMSGEEMFNMNNSYVIDGNGMTSVNNVEDVTNQHVLMDDRSRHSSAESDPNLVKSAPMSPHGIHGHHHQFPQNNSYVEIGGQRLRHQSAGDQPNPALATLKPPDWMQDPTLDFNNSDELQDMFDHRRSQSVPIVEFPPNVDVSSATTMDYLPTSFLDTESRSTSKDVIMTSSHHQHHTVTSSASSLANNGSNNQQGNNNDDLDLTLSALKDCDKDFSKFVQEVENSDAGSDEAGK